MLLNEALPAYITQSFTKVVTESMVREITGTTMPIMRELVGGLAEVNYPLCGLNLHPRGTSVQPNQSISIRQPRLENFCDPRALIP